MGGSESWPLNMAASGKAGGIGKTGGKATRAAIIWPEWRGCGHIMADRAGRIAIPRGPVRVNAQTVPVCGVSFGRGMAGIAGYV